MRKSAIGLGLALLMTVGAVAADVTSDVAWEETFDNPDAPAAAMIFYNDKGGGRSGEDFTIRQLADGVLRLGIRYDPALKEDELSMVFGNPLWWPPAPQPWGPFVLADYPFVEIKWRSNGEGFTFYYAVETADGATRAGYTWPHVDRTETDAAGREWTITRFRIAPDSSVPTSATAVKLLGLNINVRCFPSQGRAIQKEDVFADIDYIRIRAFTPEEAVRERNVVDAFQDFPQDQWSGFDTFFPFGVYAAGYLRGDFEYWGGDYQGVYGLFSRYRFNLVAANDEVELGRFGGQQSETGLESFIQEMDRHIRWARDAGIKLTADVRRMMDTRDPYDGYRVLLPMTRQLAQAFPDDDVVVAWKLADEPGANQVLNYGMMIRALKEADPLQRPDLIVFNNAAAYTPYAPYSQLAYWDHYPGHDPWAVRQTARDYRQAAAGKPVWAVLQAFETRPPANGVYERTSDAETRMMAYLALAEGAKGLIWYVGWQASGRDEGMITRTGNPQGGWMNTLKDLSRALVPIGRQLLAADPLEELRKTAVKKGDVPVKLYDFAPSAGSTPAETAVLRVQMCDFAVPLSLVRRADGRGMEVSVLKHRRLPAYYLILINEDLDSTRRADITLPSEMLEDRVGVYDLNLLDGRNLLSDNAFSPDPLAGGDGRIFLVADARTYQAHEKAIRCDRALEDARVLQPDLTLAANWGLPVQDVEDALAACRKAAERGDAPEAETRADLARSRLRRQMADNSEFNVTRCMLAEIARELDEVVRIAEMDTLEPEWWTGRKHPMMVPNPGFLELSKHYWNVGRRYRDLYTRFLRGEKDGLSGDVFRLRSDCLQSRDALLAMLRSRLKPQAAPPAE